MSKGLSNKLLVHSASLEVAGVKDAYGNITYGTAIALTKVRVVRVKETEKTSLGDSKDDKLKLLFDNTKSLPSGTTFSKGDRITFDSDKYIVRDSTSPCGDSSTPVYYRVKLVTDGN